MTAVPKIAKPGDPVQYSTVFVVLPVWFTSLSASSILAPPPGSAGPDRYGGISHAKESFPLSASAVNVPMIVSDYNLELARQRAVQSIRRYDDVLDADDVSVLRLRVHLDAGDRLPPGKQVSAYLFVMDVDPSTSTKSDPDVDLMNSTGQRAVAAASADVSSALADVVLTQGGEFPQEPGVDDEDPAAADGETDGGIVELGDGANRMAQWREVEKRLFVQDFGDQFTSFDHQLPYGVPCQVWVEFHVIESDPLTDVLDDVSEVGLGYAVTSLNAILEAPNELVEVEIKSMDRTAVVGTARFGVEWIQDKSALMAFEVRTHVDKREGWPFSSKRIFFVLYRQEYDGQWTPLYRSEVREKKTNHPDSRGCMLFTIAEVNANTATAGNVDGAIRIEFFQYKTSRQRHKLLGSVMTSLKQLRQSDPNTDLKMQVSAFTNAELVGRVLLERSRLSFQRSYFCLQAYFGGPDPVECNFVFVDLSLSYTKGFFRSQPGATVRSVFSSNRPYYQLNRGDTKDPLDWGDVVYRSDGSVKHPGERMLKFQLAKVNIAKLTGGDLQRPVCISFHSGRGARIGRVKTSLASLMEMQPGNVMAIKFRTLANHGYVVLQRKEWTENNAYISLMCVLGEEFCEPISSDSEDMSEIVEIPSVDNSSIGNEQKEASRISTPIDTPISTPTSSPVLGSNQAADTHL